jgi:hypothetical protein
MGRNFRCLFLLSVLMFDVFFPNVSFPRLWWWRTGFSDSDTMLWWALLEMVHSLRIVQVFLERCWNVMIPGPAETSSNSLARRQRWYNGKWSTLKSRRATKSKREQVANLTSCSICCTFSFFSVQLLPQHLRPSNPSAPGLDSTPELKETPKEKPKTHGFVPVWGLQAGHATGSGGQCLPELEG